MYHFMAIAGYICVKAGRSVINRFNTSIKDSKIHFIIKFSNQAQNISSYDNVNDQKDVFREYGQHYLSFTWCYQYQSSINMMKTRERC